MPGILATLRSLPSRVTAWRLRPAPARLAVNHTSFPRDAQANPDALALAVKSGAVERSDLRESLALVLEVERTAAHRSDRSEVRALNYPKELFQLARELRRILRSA